MKIDLYTKIVLTVIAVLLSIIILKDINLVSEAHASQLSFPPMRTVQANEDNYVNQQPVTWEDNINCYAVIGSYVYYNGVRIEGADGYNFIVLSDGYARDNYNIFYKGEKSTSNVNSSDIKKLKVLSAGYAKASIYILYKGKQIDIDNNPKILCEE